MNPTQQLSPLPTFNPGRLYDYSISPLFPNLTTESFSRKPNKTLVNFH
jgi:hypothetical protein